VKIENLSKNGPIIIFGTGGSGTRVIAEILGESGCYLGSNLNRALDNMDCAFFLGGRIEWIERYFPFEGNSGASRIEKAIRIFEKVYFKKNLQMQELIYVFKVVFEYLCGANRRVFRRRPLSERLKSGKQLLKTIVMPQGESLTSFQKWGFKSPESIYFLKPFIRFFPDSKIIHVIRDGRDIALSKHRLPLLYRYVFNIEEHSDPVLMAFQNWAVVNAWAKKTYSESLSSSHYLLIKYEDLCKAPEKSVDRILDFTELIPPDRRRILKIPKQNPSVGRWQKHKDKFRQLDTSILNEFNYR
jgi:hypothetical protein